jgi:hypothetical protein
VRDVQVDAVQPEHAVRVRVAQPGGVDGAAHSGTAERVGGPDIRDRSRDSRWPGSLMRRRCARTAATRRARPGRARPRA